MTLTTPHTTHNTRHLTRTIDGVGVKIVNNKIHTAPHNAIQFGQANNMEIYFNEIYDVCREASDVGAFYQGRDWTSQGSYISYNYIHDIIGFGTEGVSAIYFDDQASGSTVFGKRHHTRKRTHDSILSDGSRTGNIIKNVETGIVMGGGRSNRVNNNIFIDLTYGTTSSSLLSASLFILFPSVTPAQSDLALCGLRLPQPTKAMGADCRARVPSTTIPSTRDSSRCPTSPRPGPPSSPIWPPSSTTPSAPTLLAYHSSSSFVCCSMFSDAWASVRCAFVCVYV
jgi:hypothetical protein